MYVKTLEGRMTFLRTHPSIADVGQQTTEHTPITACAEFPVQGQSDIHIRMAVSLGLAVFDIHGTRLTRSAFVIVIPLEIRTSNLGQDRSAQDRDAGALPVEPEHGRVHDARDEEPDPAACQRRDSERQPGLFVRVPSWSYLYNTKHN